MTATSKATLLLTCIIFFRLSLGLSAAEEAVTNQRVLIGIEAAQEGLRQWDGHAMTHAADQLGATQSTVAHEEFWRHYWRGTALFHAVLHQGERESSERTTHSKEALWEQAMAALTEAISLSPEDGESHAMKAVLFGRAIRERPFTALWRGREFMKHKNLAREHGQDNPRITYLLGASMLQRAQDPASVKASLEPLLEAVSLYEKEQGQPHKAWEPTWGYDLAQMFVGVGYEQLGDFEEASSWYRRAETTNPNLGRAQRGYARCLKRMEDAR